MTYFEYNGKTSKDFDLKVSSETTIHSPGMDISFQSVPGRDGEVAISNNRFESVELPIYCNLMTKDNIEEKASNISQWLKSNIRYQDLLLSWDPKYIYQAIFFEKYDINTMTKNFGKVIFNFKVHPYKYSKIGKNPIKFIDSKDFTNPEIFISKPLIKIKGSGDITLKNNGKDWLILYNVDREIIIDSENKAVYNSNGKQYDKINSNLRPIFPELGTGLNTITCEGLVTEVSITPNWRRII